MHTFEPGIGDTDDLADPQCHLHHPTQVGWSKRDKLRADRQAAKLPNWYKTALAAVITVAVLVWLIVAVLVASYDGDHTPAFSALVAVAAVMAVVVAVAIAVGVVIDWINHKAAEQDQLDEWRHRELLAAAGDRAAAEFVADADRVINGRQPGRVFRMQPGQRG